jgi:hypothetical protein
MYETIEIANHKADIFGIEADMNQMLNFYRTGCPNVRILRYGFNMDLGFVIEYEHRGY